jgi:hypothetical protein
MNDIFKTIKDLPEAVLPKKLAKKTFNKVLIIKLRPYIYAFTAIIFANFIWLAIYTYQYLMNNEVLTVMKVMFDDFDLSSDYILNSLAGLKEILPLYRLSLFTLNFIVIGYLATLFQHYRHELLKY